MGFSLSSILPTFLVATAPAVASYLTKPETGHPGLVDEGEQSFLSSILKSDVGTAIVKTGVEAFFGEKEGEDRGPAEIKFPSVVTPRGGQTQATRLPVGATNSAVQLAIQRSANRRNFNPQYQRIYDDAGIARTLQQGRRTVGLSGPSLPQATKAAAATVRKLEDEG
jgi:hypothetical protein